MQQVSRRTLARSSPEQQSVKRLPGDYERINRRIETRSPIDQAIHTMQSFGKASEPVTRQPAGEQRRLPGAD